MTNGSAWPSLQQFFGPGYIYRVGRGPMIRWCQVLPSMLTLWRAHWGIIGKILREGRKEKLRHKQAKQCLNCALRPKTAWLTHTQTHNWAITKREREREGGRLWSQQPRGQVTASWARFLNYISPPPTPYWAQTSRIFKKSYKLLKSDPIAWWGFLGSEFVLKTVRSRNSPGQMAPTPLIYPSPSLPPPPPTSPSSLLIRQPIFFQKVHSGQACHAPNMLAIKLE